MYAVVNLICTALYLSNVLQYLRCVLSYFCLIIRNFLFCLCIIFLRRLDDSQYLPYISSLPLSCMPIYYDNYWLKPQYSILRVCIIMIEVLYLFGYTLLKCSIIKGNAHHSSTFNDPISENSKSAKNLFPEIEKILVNRN